MKTLFGEIEFRPPSKCQGHADVPGHGPKGETVYAFPSKSRCPRCGSTATLATCTKGQVQHRKCQACGHRYKVTGREV